MNKNDYSFTKCIIYHTNFHTLMNISYEYLSTGLCKKFYMNTDGGILHVMTFLKTKKYQKQACTVSHNASLKRKNSNVIYVHA